MSASGAQAPDEFGLIAELFAPLSAGCSGALSLTDDAAFLAADPGFDTVATMDAMVAGVHFLPDDPPDLIARKLVRVNLSDLAAKGAVARYLMLAAAFPKGIGMDWLRAFAEGLRRDVEEFGVSLIGGDTVATPGPLTLSLTALGRVEAGRGLRRSGAVPGDHIYVSGSIGDGALGLLAAQGRLPGLGGDRVEELAGRYRLPQPRVGLGPALVGLARACMDVSDGLVQDLGHICRVSGVSAVIEAERVPLSDAGRAAVAADQSLLALVLTGGDDYELLFTVPPGAARGLAALSRRTGVALTRIGRIEAATPSAEVSVLGPDGAALALPRSGWRHF